MIDHIRRPAEERFHRINKAKVKKRAKSVIGMVFRYILIIDLGYMILYPILQYITQAFTHPYDAASTAFVWLPPTLSMDNIRMAWELLRYPTAFTYTFVSTAVVMLCQMLGSAFFGYSFARLKFKGSGVVFALVVLTIIVPQSALMLPQYIHFRNFDFFGIIQALLGHPLNLLNQRASIYILSFVGQGLSGGLFIYIFRQFFRGIPKELEEAAYIDGAGFLRTFFRIVLPVARLAFVTVGTLSFVWNWNDTYFPRLFNPTDNYLNVRIQTLKAPSGGDTLVQQAISRLYSNAKTPEAIANLRSIVRLKTEAYDTNILATCALLTIIPLIILFLVVQKQFVEGVERSGIVG